jgi:hypothetical protein
MTTVSRLLAWHLDSSLLLRFATGTQITTPVTSLEDGRQVWAVAEVLKLLQTVQFVLRINFRQQNERTESSGHEKWFSECSNKLMFVEFVNGCISYKRTWSDSFAVTGNMKWAVGSGLWAVQWWSYLACKFLVLHPATGGSRVAQAV